MDATAHGARTPRLAFGDSLRLLRPRVQNVRQHIRLMIRVVAAAHQRAALDDFEAAAEAFFSAGTNRRMWRFTAINYLCRDMEQLHDVTRPGDWVWRVDMLNDRRPDTYAPFTRAHVPLRPVRAAQAHLAR